MAEVDEAEVARIAMEFFATPEYRAAVFAAALNLTPTGEEFVQDRLREMDERRQRERRN